MQRFIGRLCAFVLAFLVMTGGARATSANTDVSDIWWNPTESGWGMQMVNTGTFVFATIYIYGLDIRPTWLTGQLTRTGAAQITFSGPLYVTTGPYFGGPFNPGAVGARQVGTMTFVLTTVTSGQLTYSVDGVVVTKAVQRQPLTLDNYSGNYAGTVTATTSGCISPADNGTGTFPINMGITQNGQSMSMVLAVNGGSCSFVGTYSQLGRMGQASGTTTCADGSVSSATFFEMSNVPYMFTARLQTFTPADGCGEVGEIAGVIPR